MTVLLERSKAAKSAHLLSLTLRAQLVAP